MQAWTLGICFADDAYSLVPVVQNTGLPPFETTSSTCPNLLPSLEEAEDDRDDADVLTLNTCGTLPHLSQCPLFSIDWIARWDICSCDLTFTKRESRRRDVEKLPTPSTRGG